jgi:hypothetical protein
VAADHERAGDRDTICELAGLAPKPLTPRGGAADIAQALEAEVLAETYSRSALVLVHLRCADRSAISGMRRRVRRVRRSPGAMHPVDA